ncbi:MAG: outer membrane lipoprotein LolB [Gammaproteobacteria bacterium]|nr:MAG: outer membrane lipoprotein LolB [Gammaproteobacteria bacterium]
MTWRLVALATLALLVSACSTTVRHPAGGTSLEQWEMRGKFSARTRDDSHSGSWRWLQNADNNTLSLSGPLGVAATEISSDGHTATIRRGGGHITVSADNTDALGIDAPLPLPAMRYWLLGQAAPATLYPIAASEREHGSLSALTQAGWSLHFNRYEAVGTMQLPGLIIATHGDVRLKLLVKHWDFSVSPDISPVR